MTRYWILDLKGYYQNCFPESIPTGHKYRINYCNIDKWSDHQSKYILPNQVRIYYVKCTNIFLLLIISHEHSVTTVRRLYVSLRAIYKVNLIFILLLEFFYRIRFLLFYFYTKGYKLIPIIQRSTICISPRLYFYVILLLNMRQGKNRTSLHLFWNSKKKIN